MAGFKPFWTIALRRYRKALKQKYHELKIPFQHNRPLEMKDVFVPFRVMGERSRKEIGAYQAVQKHKQLVILGAPGSGKTMLLQNLAFTYAVQGLRDIPYQPVPLLFELNRLKYGGIPLVEQLEKVLEQNNFPRARGFLTSFLKRGQMLLLFDGLDEVHSKEREQAVRHVKDLLATYPACRAVITCRTAVYKEQFVDSADQHLEIIEFNDQQIQHFLSAWEPDMPGDKSIEHLLHTLRERPRIMAIARNPLLLTMIAYLYTNTTFILPHSRSEFYSESTKLLLDKWKNERNDYKGIHKSLVLRHFALFNQLQEGTDRRNIELPVILEQIRKVLPSLTLKDDDAQPLLDEIVERSGLLLSIDGGARYQFTHLTVQEYFAARALKDAPEKLIEYFLANRDSWREVIRLWCGLEHDSTGLIEKLFPADSLMAFECLGDAQQVDTKCVATILKQFKTRLKEAGTDESLARAFALVAADPRDRGMEVFSFIKENLSVPANRRAAATILTLTNLPRAAQVLTEQAFADKEMAPFLANMGDLAVQVIAETRNHTRPSIMDIVCKIGTPRAVLLLVPLLWDDNEIVPYHAAWRLASMLTNPNVENTLRGYELTPGQRKEKQIDWIWAPFKEPVGSSLPVIAGRIAYLLHTALGATIPAGTSSLYDPRLVIPLCAVAARDGKIRTIDKIDKKKKKEWSEEIERIEKSISPLHIKQKTAGTSEHKDFIENHMEKISTDPVWLHLFKSLAELPAFKLLGSLVRNDPTPEKKDWLNVFRPSVYNFTGSWQKRSLWVLVLLLCLCNIGGLIFDAFWISQSWKGEYLLSISGVIVMCILLFIMGRKELRLKSCKIGYAFFMIGSGFSWSVIITFVFTHGTGGIVAGWIAGIIFCVLTIIYNIYKNVFTANDNVIVDDNVIVVADIVGGVAGAVVGVVVAGAVGGVIVGVVFCAVGDVAGPGPGVALGVGLGGIFGAVGGGTLGGDGGGVIGSVLGGIIIGGGIDILLFYQPTTLVYRLWNWPGAVIFWVVYISVVSFIIWHASRKDRKSRNPLYGLLETEGTEQQIPL